LLQKQKGGSVENLAEIRKGRLGKKVERLGKRPGETSEPIRKRKAQNNVSQGRSEGDKKEGGSEMDGEKQNRCERETLQVLQPSLETFVGLRGGDVHGQNEWLLKISAYPRSQESTR